VVTVWNWPDGGWTFKGVSIFDPVTPLIMSSCAARRVASLKYSSPSHGLNGQLLGFFSRSLFRISNQQYVSCYMSNGGFYSRKGRIRMERMFPC